MNDILQLPYRRFLPQWELYCRGRIAVFRELFNLLERASVLDEQDFTRLLAEHKQMTASLSQNAAAEVPDELDAAIRLHVKHVYEKYNNNLSKTAEALKAARNTVRKYLE